METVEKKLAANDFFQTIAEVNERNYSTSIQLLALNLERALIDLYSSILSTPNDGIIDFPVKTRWVEVPYPARLGCNKENLPILLKDSILQTFVERGFEFQMNTANYASICLVINKKK